MKKGKLLREEKTKRLYETDDPEKIILEFTKNQEKGITHAQISAKLFQIVESKGVATHFEQLLSEREMLVKRLEMLLIKVHVRNRAAGRMSKTFGLEEGAALACPVYELSFKSEPLGEPFMNEYHALSMKLATEEELKTIRERSFQVNHTLKHFFEEKGLELIDFELEFGRFKGKILLADEISPDTCRLWDMKTGKKLEKDEFRRDLWGVEPAYQEVLRRVVESK